MNTPDSFQLMNMENSDLEEIQTNNMSCHAGMLGPSTEDGWERQQCDAGRRIETF